MTLFIHPIMTDYGRLLLIIDDYCSIMLSLAPLAVPRCGTREFFRIPGFLQIWEMSNPVRLSDLILVNVETARVCRNPYLQRHDLVILPRRVTHCKLYTPIG